MWLETGPLIPGYNNGSTRSSQIAITSIFLTCFSSWLRFFSFSSVEIKSMLTLNALMSSRYVCYYKWLFFREKNNGKEKHHRNVVLSVVDDGKSKFGRKFNLLLSLQGGSISIPLTSVNFTFL